MQSIRPVTRGWRYYQRLVNRSAQPAALGAAQAEVHERANRLIIAARTRPMAATGASLKSGGQGRHVGHKRVARLMSTAGPYGASSAG